MTEYQIIDEPRPSSISHLTANPVWPLLSHMLGSPFYAWIWYGLNSFALGSPTRRRELALIVLGVVGTFVWIIGVFALEAGEVISRTSQPYTRLGLTIFSLTISYFLYMLQHSPFEIHKYFEGKVMNGTVGLVLAVVIGKKVQSIILSLVF